MTDAVEPTTLSSADGDALVRLAAMAVATWVRSGGATSPDARTAPAAVSGPGACFVTLRADGQLRGCIGSLVPHRPLADDVVANATAKRLRKGCDWLLANDVNPSTGIMGGSENAVTLITGEGAETWPRMSKRATAEALADRIAEALA